MTQDRTRWKEYKAKIDDYREKHDINIVCQSSTHDDQIVGSFTRVSSRMVSTNNPPSAPVLNDDFAPAAAGIPTAGEHRNQHDAGQYSTSLTRDNDTRLSDYDARLEPSRGHHQLRCRQCGHNVPARDEHLQPILKQMDGKSSVLTLAMLETLLHNQ